MTKYLMLVNILDQIRSESTGTRFESRYNPPLSDINKINQARARAFIHLYLKVGFGLLGFEGREHFITDGTGDGGIDGYFVDREARQIYFIQSKFRTTQDNFESKAIELEEILAMDCERILSGEGCDEKGIDYNGKIAQLQREISGIEDIGRYKYRIVLLANLNEVADAKLRRLVGGYPVEIFNHERCYERLVFPVVSGNFFNATDVNINIDLSNKNAGTKISYTVSTSYGECEITVLFVPTIDIAKVINKYKNAILKYNPRSYLEFEGQKVNTAIRDTILSKQTNEFALFNNGITMLSDETYINERIGQKNKAQLTVKNPQIINGGQTAYTLGRIYDEVPHDQVNELFSGKEVLLKVITLLRTGDGKMSQDDKLNLIEQISTATNQQTQVITADRISNEKVYLDIQKILFDRYGLLYERKRGEFADGMHKSYITDAQVVERNLFFRIYLASNGKIDQAAQKKLFLRFEKPEQTVSDVSRLDKFYFGFLCSKKLDKGRHPATKRSRDLYAKIFAMTVKYMPEDIADGADAVNRNLSQFNEEWNSFLERISNLNTKHIKTFIDKETREVRTTFNLKQWIRSNEFETDVISYFAQ